MKRACQHQWDKEKKYSVHVNNKITDQKKKRTIFGWAHFFLCDLYVGGRIENSFFPQNDRNQSLASSLNAINCFRNERFYAFRKNENATVEYIWPMLSLRLANVLNFELTFTK